MGKRVQCPRCLHSFRVHGDGRMAGQEVVKCYECNRLFNPRRHFVDGKRRRR